MKGLLMDMEKKNAENKGLLMDMEKKNAEHKKYV